MTELSLPRPLVPPRTRPLPAPTAAVSGQRSAVSRTKAEFLARAARRQRTAERGPLDRGPCAHLGPVVEVRKGKGCTNHGRTIEVRACAVRGTCSSCKNAPNFGILACRLCDDHLPLTSDL